MDPATLLLQGWKMTPKHCQCGYPLFEKDGKLICPRCSEAPKEEGDFHLEKRLEELLKMSKEEQDLRRLKLILECIKLIKEIKEK
ncbi:MAG: Sjogren's syndrome/scleroderma autoantigen 1 family protein [Candidatus Methanofastidiosia archaeon]